MIYSLKDYDFELPQEQIAIEAIPVRSASRMLLVDRAAASFDDETFAALPGFLRAGDVLILNNTRVFPARLFAISDTGARIETFLVEEIGTGIWTVLAKPGKRLSEGKLLRFSEDVSATVVEKRADGTVVLQFECEGDLTIEFD